MSKGIDEMTVEELVIYVDKKRSLREWLMIQLSVEKALMEVAIDLIEEKRGNENKRV